MNRERFADCHSSAPAQTHAPRPEGPELSSDEHAERCGIIALPASSGHNPTLQSMPENIEWKERIPRTTAV